MMEKKKSETQADESAAMVEVERKLKVLHDAIYDSVIQITAIRATCSRMAELSQGSIPLKEVKALEDRYRAYAEEVGGAEEQIIYRMASGDLFNLMVASVVSWTAAPKPGAPASLATRWMRTVNEITSLYGLGFAPIEGTKDVQRPGQRYTVRIWRGVPLCMRIGTTENSWAPMQLADVFAAIDRGEII